MANFLRRWRLVAGALAIVAGGLILALNFWIPAGADNEYIYTVRWLRKYILPICVCLFICVIFTLPIFRKGASSRFALIAMLAGICALAVPFMGPDDPEDISWRLGLFFSACWFAGLFCIGISFFLAAPRASSFRASLFCLAGSVCLALAAGEGWVLATPQFFDGTAYENKASRHLVDKNAVFIAKSWEEGICGLQTVRSGKAIAETRRYTFYDEEIYDVVYEYDGMGRRPMPAASSQPEYDLLLFGCSYTYGHGLNTSDTWAWKLAKLLGPEWKVENYALNGYSVNQMLCFLEHDLVEKPTAPHRYALFLGIQDQIRRNEFFSSYPHYVLDANGQPLREGEGRYVWLQRLPHYFRGSQLAKHASILAGGAILRVKMPEYQKLYLAMLKRSSELLRQKYNAELIVMLWPDLEHLTPDLEHAHIPVVLARSMLPDWDDPHGTNYKINTKCESHPNAKAGTDLANGLAAYLEKLAASKQ